MTSGCSGTIRLARRSEQGNACETNVFKIFRGGKGTEKIIHNWKTHLAVGKRRGKAIGKERTIGELI